MTDKSILIECADASLGYENEPVLKHLNFTIEEGDYVCVVGENGCGKSTLMKTVLGLIKPVAGMVKLENSLKNGCIGYLPQQTQTQRDFPATVYEIVLSGFLSQCRKRPFYKASEKKEALANMEKMSIIDLKKKCYRELSGGQQQRVLLARALCAASKLIVLDEPVTGLDPMATQELYQTLNKINREGTAILMVSHDYHNAVLEAKKILHIYDGGYFYGTIEEYHKSEVGSSFAGGGRRC